MNPLKLIFYELIYTINGHMGTCPPDFIPAIASFNLSNLSGKIMKQLVEIPKDSLQESILMPMLTGEVLPKYIGACH